MLRASCGETPLENIFNNSGPYSGRTKDWVATTPTPGLAHNTNEPTENQ